MLQSSDMKKSWKRLSMNLRSFSARAEEISVYISQCNDPFSNLAFEDWVYSNIDLTKKRLLFLWRNQPTVVIGRHQNPWLECDIKKLQQNGVRLARRKSGGGTVYHDLGNLNATFFTHRSAYNRPENLALIVKALRDRWELDVEASPRDDILLNGHYKISGTSSKLGRVTSFHHCTLLLDVDTRTLSRILNPTYEKISCNATASVRAEVKNLCSIEPTLDFFTVSHTIAQVFCNQYAPDKPAKVTEVDPKNEQHFPGINVLSSELQTWQWTYGKTPRFRVPFSTTLSFGHLTLVFHSYHGTIEDLQVTTDSEHATQILQQLAHHVKGKRFWPGDIANSIQTFVGTQPQLTDRQYCYEVMHWLTRVL